MVAFVSNINIEERDVEYEKLGYNNLNGFGRFKGEDIAGNEYEYIGNFVNGKIINGTYRAKAKVNLHLPITEVL